MRVGVNYMWGYDKYGYYFGPHWRYGEGPREPWMDGWLVDFENNLVEWKRELRVDVVRIFLLCNLQNFGNVGDDGRWVPPATIDDRYFEQFQRMLDIGVKTGVQLIPSLLDFGIGEPKIHHERRCRVITEPGLREEFFEQVLVSLLRLANQERYRPSIYAFEIMNEPSWLTGHFWPRPGSLPRPMMPRVSRDALSEFLKQGVALVARYSLPSTVGHRFYSDLWRYPTGSIPQFHYYPHPLNRDPRRLPWCREAFVGEFAAGIEGRPWRNLAHRDRPGPREKVCERLRALEQLGYRLALIWPDLPCQGSGPGHDPKLSGEAKAGIREYWDRG